MKQIFKIENDIIQITEYLLKMVLKEYFNKPEYKHLNPDFKIEELKPKKGAPNET